MGLLHRANQIDRTIVHVLSEVAIPFLRISLGLTYIWFGTLKILSVSPVHDLVTKTAFLLPKELFARVLGVFEVVIGLGLLFRVALRLTLLLFFLQLAGTFSVFFTRPREGFREGNPFLLTKDGEFIIKNLVLLAAGLAVGSTARRKDEDVTG